MTRTLMGIPAAAFALGILFVSPPSFAQETYSLKRTFKAGETDRYKTTLDIEGAGNMKLQVVFVTTEKTEEVKDDGTMVRSITVESAEMAFGGQSMPMPGFQKVTMTATMDKDGKVIKEEGQGGQFRQFLSMTRPIVEADKPLKVGEEWKTEIPTNKDGTKKLNVVVTLVGLEEKSEKLALPSYKVKTVAEGTVETGEGDQKVKMESVTLAARDNLKLVRSEGTMTGLTIPQFGPAKISFKVELQPAAAPASSSN